MVVIEKDVQMWIAQNWGWVVFVIIILVLNGKQVLASLESLIGKFVPSIAQIIKERDNTERRRLEDRHELDEANIANAQDNLAVVLALMAKNQDRLLTQFESTMERFWQDRQDDRKVLDKALGEIVAMKQSIMSMTSQISLHSMTIAKMSDNVEALQRNGSRKRE